MPKLGLLITTLTYTLTLQQLTELAKAGEESGFDSLWVPESWCRDAFGSSLAYGMATKHIQVGTSIVTAFARTPTATAMAALTVEEQLPGRFNLGIGIGHSYTVEDWFGVPFDQSITRMREYIQIVRNVMSGEEFSYEGKKYSIRNFKLACPAPKRKIPVYLAAVRPQMMRLAGEVADGALAAYMTKECLREARGQLDEGARRAGRDPSEVKLNCLIPTCVTDDTKAGRDAVRYGLAWYCNWPYYSSQMMRLGYTEEGGGLRKAWGHDTQRDEEIHRKWRDGYASPEALAAVTDEMVESLGVVGGRERCAERFKEYREVGVDLPIVMPVPMGGDVLESMLGTARALGE